MGRQIDKHSTADDVLAGCNLTGRLAVVTGAAAGIGRETARALAACGADVIACGRDREAIASAADHMSMATERTVRPRCVDLESLSRRYNADMSGVQVKSVAQGAATPVLAATAPFLHGIRTVYLEDCEVAPVIDAPLYVRGVMRYALDSNNAARLWKAAEIMTGTEMPLVR